ncbi:unnamed protein product [marine sediment metagenome]|uniref:SpoVT-AbrB domain-containing protein n=1 Tax=marine sediment metagenome TaxID=412755 RepID=X0SAM3_9ZZZZ
MVNNQTTTLTKANNTSESLRTTVPSSIIKQFDLTDGDKISWKLEARDSELVIIVAPGK